MALLSNESRIILTLEALKNNNTLSLRATAKTYSVSAATLLRRRDGKPTRRDSPVNSKKLTQTEEEAIIRYILKLATRSFPPRLYSIEDIANQLLHVRDAPPIGKL